MTNEVELHRRIRRTGRLLMVVVIAYAYFSGNPRLPWSGRDRIAIHTLTFDGIRSVDEDELRALLHNRPSSWIPWHSGLFNHDAVDGDLRRIEAFYKAHGYSNARIVSFFVELDLRTHSVDLHVAVDEGLPDEIFEV